MMHMQNKQFQYEKHDNGEEVVTLLRDGAYCSTFIFKRGELEALLRFLGPLYEEIVVLPHIEEAAYIRGQQSTIDHIRQTLDIWDALRNREKKE
jgi:hypothetical protein